ncbi:MAG TPA: MBL fold metallo-hydrolase [Anaeromyxobacteraceae bacterium]|nr:MBL fold metallo-hydrolase [Anaeromyxobacteraceae bacterium]
MTNPPYRIVLPGVPVSSKRGALGWCNVVLLRRAGHTILFDTGSFGDRHPLLSRLGELGVDPGDVDLVFASHFHYDHVANAEIFRCPVVLSESEWRHVQEAGYLAAGDPFVPRALVPFVRDRVVTVKDGEELIAGLRAVVLPGHTPGTTGLLLEDDGVLLAGDAVKNAWDFVRGEPPPSFFTRETAQANYRRIRELAGTVVPGHDRAFEIAPDGGIRYLESARVDLELYADPRSDPRVVNLLEDACGI